MHAPIDRGTFSLAVTDDPLARRGGPVASAPKISGGCASAGETAIVDYQGG
jgi:hypothetical protein